MDIYKGNEEIYCDNCMDKTENRMWIIDNKSIRENALCDKCLQELNRKIVEYLAEKHL